MIYSREALFWPGVSARQALCGAPVAVAAADGRSRFPLIDFPSIAIIVNAPTSVAPSAI